MTPPSPPCGKDGVANTCLSVLVHICLCWEQISLSKRRGREGKGAIEKGEEQREEGGGWLARAATLRSSRVSVSCPV